MEMSAISIINLLATIALVGITGWYAYINKKILKSNDESFNEQLRPYIIVHIFSIDLMIKFQIKNIGKRPAKDIKIKIDPPIENLDLLSKPTEQNTNVIPLLEQTFIPPNFSISTVLMDTPELFNHNDIELRYTFTIEYLDLNNKKYKETYVINLENYITPKKVAESSELQALKKINTTLEKLNVHIKNFKK